MKPHLKRRILTRAALQIEDYSSAVVVLLTDGENTRAPEPLDVAQLAAEAGVRIYPIGIGSPEGAVLEIDGFNIVTQLNETSLARDCQPDQWRLLPG